MLLKVILEIDEQVGKDQRIRKYMSFFDVSDWTEVTRGKEIEFKIEDYPLQVRTDSVVGSNDILRVYMSPEETSGGTVRIRFTDPPQYRIDYCSSGNITITNMPAENTRVWTITKNAISVDVFCNGVEIFSYLFSESGKTDCVTRWGEDTMVKIFFVTRDSDTDTASDEYRSKPSGN